MAKPNKLLNCWVYDFEAGLDAEIGQQLLKSCPKGLNSISFPAANRHLGYSQQGSNLESGQAGFDPLGK